MHLAHTNQGSHMSNKHLEEKHACQSVNDIDYEIYRFDMCKLMKTKTSTLHKGDVVTNDLPTLWFATYFCKKGKFSIHNFSFIC